MNRKKIVRKKKNTVSVKIITIIMIILFLIISVSYAVLTTDLVIDGNVTLKYVEPELEIVPVSKGSNRFSTNTKLTAGWFNYEIFSIIGDTYDGNTVITNLKNGTKTFLTASTIAITFTVTLTNDSEYQLTNGAIKVEELDSKNYIQPNSQTLSKTTLNNGDTTTLTAKITFNARNKITIGDYVNYKISYICNGIKRYFNYKVLIV